jgi:hypothetical protein
VDQRCRRGMQFRKNHKCISEQFVSLVTDDAKARSFVHGDAIS